MMWTYRVMRDEKGRYSVREVFYEQDGTPMAYGREPVQVVEGSLTDLMQLVTWLNDALELPVLSTEDLDTRIAARPQPTAGERNISLQQVLAELEVQGQPEPAPR